MIKTKDKVYDAAENVKPYVERAISDEKLRADVLSAFGTARELYNEIVGSRSAVTIASRVATDEDVREKLKSAIDDLRSATDRLQGRAETKRHTGLLFVGLALGLLFNPWTGPETRRWLKELVAGSDDEFGGDYPPPAPNGGATIPD